MVKLHFFQVAIARNHQRGPSFHGQSEEFVVGFISTDRSLRSDLEKLNRLGNFDQMAQAAKLRAQGVSADDAARRVDLTAHAKDFPDIEGVGAEVRGIRRVYAWMDETGRK